MADNVGSVPVNPGDVIREGQTGMDYIVDVVVAGAAAGIVIYGIHLFDSSIRTWAIEDVDDFAQSGLKTIVRNITGRSPQDVQRAALKTIDQASRLSGQMGDASFKGRLASKQGEFFRTFLMIGDQIDQFDKKLSDLSKALVQATGRRWTLRGLSNLGRSMTPSWLSLQKSSEGTSMCTR